MNKALTAVVMATTALGSIVSSPAFAAGVLIDPIPAPEAANQDTLDAMQDVCTEAAQAHDTNNGDIWEGEVVPGTVVLQAGPTETGSHDITDAIAGTLAPAEGATFTPNDPTITGDPYRNGGSVNMFGVQESGGGIWSASQYDYLGEFTTTYRHNFSCNIYVSVFHPETLDNGRYEINPDEQGGEEDAILKECEAYNKRGQRLPLPGYWGNSPQGNCIFVPGESIPEYYDPPALKFTETGFFHDQDQVNTLKAHETNGESYETDDNIIRQVVVCISPSNTGKKLPGAWRAQNGYSGGSFTGPEAGCNTTWYNTGAIPAAPNNINFDSHNWVTIPGV